MRRRNRYAGAFRDRAGSVPLIGKVLRGTRAAGLIWYLYGPGRSEEHIDPRLIAGWRHPAELEPALRADGTRDFRRLNGLLSQPLGALGRNGFGKPVWHCVARAAPEDPVLSDDQWAAVAEEILHRTGLAPRGDDEAVRWVAVRHAADHIHIVATLARQDGTKPRIWNDFYRVREACRAIERRYGLRGTAPGDRTAARRPTRAETEHARRRGWQEPPRVTLRRAAHTAAAGASSEQEFFTRLEAAGILLRKRFSQRDPGEVTGYAVAMPGHMNRDGRPVWYGGGKLAADLTLPKLRKRWPTTGPEPTRRARPGARLTAEERRAIWDGAADAAARAADAIRWFAIADPAAAADAAWAASDALHVAAIVLGNRALRRAAESYDGAARQGYGRIPCPTPAGNSLRVTARLLTLAAAASDRDTAAAMRLIANLADLVAAVAELRYAQRHAAQASAARAAAERLRAATVPVPGTPQLADQVRRREGARVRTRTAADLARLDSPEGFTPPRLRPPSKQQQEPLHTPMRPTIQPRPTRGPSP
jgi:MobA/VirD2-like, nuclease domain